MGLKDRLILITKELKLSGRAFEKECGLTNGAFAGFGDRIGADILNKIIGRYPQFSARWILTGEGEMLRDDGNNNLKNIEDMEKLLEILRMAMEQNRALISIIEKLTHKPFEQRL
ncbi:MAG: hypothetical protein J6K95_04255 [Rikenellaceae bacterium]|nr:hypothetical protein [Rikenellaceae bacterium]